MDLRGLEAVIAVHERGSFSSAAETLFVSQPALTRRVALLERELGTRLFVRGNSGARLTRAGRALLAPARRTLSETESIRRTLELISTGERGTLRIAATPNLSGRIPGELIGRYHESYPGIEMRVVTAQSRAAAVASVESGTDDLAMVDLPISSDSLRAVPVVDEDFLAVFAPSVTTTGQDGEPPAVTRAMLQGRTVVQLPVEECPAQAGSRLFEMLNVTPAALIEVHACDLLATIVRSSRSVALIPRGAAMIAARAERLGVAAPPRRITRTIGLVGHRTDSSPAAVRFLAMAASSAETATPSSSKGGARRAGVA